MINKIKEIAKQNPYGFTFNLQTNAFQKYGIVVAYLETQNCFGEDGLQTAFNHAMENDMIIGGWFNSQNKEYYFDSCKIFKMLNEAIEFGKANKQIAIFDLTNLKEIKL